MAKKKDRKVIEVEEENIILRIPRDAAGIEVTATLIGEDEKVQKISRKLSVSDIREARQAFLDNVEFGDDYDAKFVLTEKGQKYLDGLEE